MTLLLIALFNSCSLKIDQKEDKWKERPKDFHVLYGSAQWMTVEGNGASIQTPVDLNSGDTDAVKKVYDAIHSLAPKPLWAKLESQRQQYMEDYTLSHQ